MNHQQHAARNVAPVFYQAFDAEPEPKAQRRAVSHASIFLAALLLAATLFYALFILRTSFDVNGKTYFTLIDDQMISMRYAQNLANGDGLVWNVGEEPVQGFTNLGWTLYMAVLHLLPVDLGTLPLLVMVTSAVLLLAVSLLTYRTVRTLAPDREMAALLSAAVVAFYYPLVFWALRGAEAGITSLLVLAAVLFAVRCSRSPSILSAAAVGLAGAAAILVRFDIALQVGLILLYLASLQGLPQKPATLLAACLPVSVAVVIVLGFQLWYFDSLHPNTYYLKVSGVSVMDRIDLGLQVFIEYASKDLLALSILAGAGALLYRDMRSREMALLGGLFAGQCLYSIYLGGDYAEPLSIAQVDAANRFITQGMPFLIILAALSFDRLAHELAAVRGNTALSRPSVRVAVAGGAALMVFAVTSGAPWARWGWTEAPLLKDDIARARLGLLIHESTDQDTTIAVHAAGQIPYYSQRRTIDLLGKSDPVIAHGPAAAKFRPGHNKWNYDHSIASLKPDLVADVWGVSATYLSKLSEYKKLSNNVYVRSDSDGMDLDLLATKYR